MMYICLQKTKWIDDRLRLLKSPILFPFISRASLRLHTKEHRRWTYWHNELSEDGMHIDDFILYIAERTASSEKLNDFQKYWRR